jgi:phosphatidate cytidylyltransferase
VLLVSAASVLGVRELYGFAEKLELRPSRSFGYATAALVAPAVYMALTRPGTAEGVALWWPFLGAMWVVAMLGWILFTRLPAARPMGAAAVTALAVLYAGALPAFLIVIRHATFGPRSWPAALLVFFPLVVTWVCDTFAMFGGMLVGGPKLWPAVSPGKTRSGGVAGVVGALLVGALFAWLVFPAVGIAAAPGSVLAVAGVLSVVGQVGDLVESAFKREVGVKDSGTLIPGHGGVLDRLDSLYFAIPVTAALYRFFGIG